MTARQPRKPALLLGIALLLSLTSSSLAQENRELGRMWTFENPPLAYLEKEYGFKPSQGWSDSLRLGSLRLGGDDVQSGSGSAAFVSPDGLILTSTRCLRDAVAATFDADAPRRGRDPHADIEHGFVAVARTDEVRLRTKRTGWLSAAQLVQITNVTDEVDQGVVPTDNEIQARNKRNANRKSILDAAMKADPQLVPQIVNLFQGAVVQLYQYRVYRDVRLVCIPHLQIAHFGGDPDSFTFPRYSIDFAFLRAYENGKPADTAAHYFKWKSGGAKKDELVFVSGNPGTTNRLLTKSQLELERDIRIPMKIEWLTNWRRELKRMHPDPENPSWRHGHWRRLILELENGLKAARGNLKGLEDAKLMAQKAAAEKAFQDRVMADKKLAEQYGDLWQRIDSVVRERRVHEAQARFHSPAHPVLYLAVEIVRLLDPDESEENRDHAESVLEGWSQTVRLAYPGNAFTLDQLIRARSWLPQDDPFFTTVLAGMSPEEFHDVYLEGKQARSSPSWLGLAERRNALVESGWEGIRKSKDPGVVAARELAILMRKNKRLGDELDAKEEALAAEMGRALLACYGTNVSPDGTTTLRFTDGIVRGVRSGGTNTPYRTTLYGLYARSTEFGGEHPFDLPKTWRESRDRIDLMKTANFVSTNDITSGKMVFDANFYGCHRWQDAGGNSGSIVVNKQLEVVGMVVDGNHESLGNDFVFSDDAPRAVSVHADGIMEALVKVYGAHRVARELTGK